MSINNSAQWISDIDYVISFLPELSSFEGKTIMITGATGLVCSALVDILIRYNETHKCHINIIVLARNLEKIKNRFAPFYDKDYFKFKIYDALRADNEFDFHCDYIIHGASNAYPAKIAQQPVETMISNFEGVKYLLEYARNEHVKRLLYISSSEVYGEKDSNLPYIENEYGYIDLLKSRNSYSISKRASETLCLSYKDEYDIDSVIVRPGHIYGPTASPGDNRVSSLWAYSAARGEDIVMKSKGSQIRSYCYCLDCASAIFKILLIGKSGEAYNISNPDSIISINELANLYAKYGDVEVIYSIPTEQEKAAFNPMINSSLDSKKLENLGWSGHFSAQIGVDHTVKILKDIL